LPFSFFNSSGLRKTSKAELQKKCASLRSRVKNQQPKPNKLFKHLPILSHVYDSGVEHLKPCDLIYFPVINFTTESDKISAKTDATGRPLLLQNNFYMQSHLETLRNASKLRKIGIKVIGHLSANETAENVMRISGNAALRTKFSASIIDVMEKLQLDGLYFQWLVPGCPRVNTTIIYNQFLSMQRNAQMKTYVQT
jgi:hypothetical protein